MEALVKVIATFKDLAQAQALRLALAREDIAAVVHGEHTVGIIAGGVEVAILDDGDLSRARAVLEGFQADSGSHRDIG